MISDLPIKHIYHSGTFLGVFTCKMAATSAGIDMEQNYVTVALCISKICLCCRQDFLTAVCCMKFMCGIDETCNLAVMFLSILPLPF